MKRSEWILATGGLLMGFCLGAAVALQYAEHIYNPLLDSLQARAQTCEISLKQAAAAENSVPDALPMEKNLPPVSPAAEIAMLEAQISGDKHNFSTTNALLAADENEITAQKKLVAQWTANANSCAKKFDSWVVITEPPRPGPGAAFAGALVGALLGGKFSALSSALPLLSQAQQSQPRVESGTDEQMVRTLIVPADVPIYTFADAAGQPASHAQYWEWHDSTKSWWGPFFPKIVVKDAEGGGQ